jgi:hypothetical protein
MDLALKGSQRSQFPGKPLLGMVVGEKNKG